MRKRTLGILTAVALVVAIALGITSGESAGLVAIGVFAVCVVLTHLWFMRFGPSASPNRFYRRELWLNGRRVHRELRAHRREVQQGLTPPPRT